jgi:hypothetical protein
MILNYGSCSRLSDRSIRKGINQTEEETLALPQIDILRDQIIKGPLRLGELQPNQ